ncbi:Paf1 complex component [Coemansia sp. RSA 1813]|nr:Paf1 complex component [Coemansia sp. RSA 1646]KAJ1773650.1 Paf1 complex component [Coemansia sp. RSA 1843]KAJ2092333.1 Paf1 complex component [Coemansia sp. RSA 986]KAJ2217438.1 Paf1 complex component [Coemansia sp. RSA 487]KAJ2572667.1 Paf1 complex component [Coemansia sp. RSA 1813]
MSDLFGSDISDSEENSQRRLSPEQDSHGSQTPMPKAEGLLSGSDDENEVGQGARRSIKNALADGGASGDLFGSDDEDAEMRGNETDSAHSSSDEGEMSKVQVRVMSAKVPVLPVPRSSDGRHVVARTPNILQLQPTPFTVDSHEDLISEEHMVAEKHGYKSAVTPELASAVEGILANTVRWRRIAVPGGTFKRESNARLVRWSDGSFTVAIGGQTPESYSISSEHLVAAGKKEQYYYAAAQHPRELLMQSHARLTEQWQVRPSRQSAQSRAAISLLLSRARAKAAGTGAQGAGSTSSGAGAKGSRMRFIVVDEDPELVAKRAEKEEEERERQRKREQRMRERREAKGYQTGRDYSEHNDVDMFAGGDYSDDEEGDYVSDNGRAQERSAGSGYERAQEIRRPREQKHAARQPPQPRQRALNAYAEEEDDGFIVDDDEELEIGSRDEFDSEEEEEELATRRLQNAKRADHMVSDSDNDNDRSREANIRSAKSRRLRDSDDEDDDM